MGLEYTMVNHQNKTCYELGRGSWEALFDANRKGSADLLYVESIQDTIINEVWNYNVAEDGNPQFWIDYAKKIALGIFEFVNNTDPTHIGLANDSDDSVFEIRQKQYRWVGSRYHEPDFDDLNKHLNPEWVKMYGLP